MPFFPERSIHPTFASNGNVRPSPSIKTFKSWNVAEDNNCGMHTRGRSDVAKESVRHKWS